MDNIRSPFIHNLRNSWRQQRSNLMESEDYEVSDVWETSGTSDDEYSGIEASPTLENGLGCCLCNKLNVFAFMILT